MTTTKKLQGFASAYDLIDEAAPELLENLDEDTADYIRSCDDFEPLAYFLADQMVIITDSITGDVIGSYDSIADFFQSALDGMEA